MNNNNQYENVVSADNSYTKFLSKVFGWMFIGLIISFGTAFYVSTSQAILNIIFSNMFILLGLFGIEIVLVVTMSSRVMKLSYGATIGIFIAYSFINGITLSTIFLVYNLGTISFSLLASALIFLIMAVYGRVTKADLSSLRTFFMIAIMGIIAVSVMNIFINSEAFSIGISMATILVFAGLTAYDMQKMKRYYNYGLQNNGTITNNLAVSGALSLYLDFINIFLAMFRIVGRRN